MKKMVLSLSLASCLFAVPSFANANEMALEATQVVWSASNGGSFYLYGVSVPYSSGLCGYIFQNTVAAFVGNFDSSGFYVEADQNGVFNYTLSPDSGGCNAFTNSYTFLVYCEMAEGASSAYAQRVYTGICTL